MKVVGGWWQQRMRRATFALRVKGGCRMKDSTSVVSAAGGWSRKRKRWPVRDRKDKESELLLTLRRRLGWRWVVAERNSMEVAGRKNERSETLAPRC